MHAPTIDPSVVVKPSQVVHNATFVTPAQQGYQLGVDATMPMFRERDKGCKPRQPLTFTGDKRGMEVGQWLQQVEIYLVLTNTAVDRWVDITFPFLSGNAFTLWSGHPANVAGCTWEEFPVA